MMEDYTSLNNKQNIPLKQTRERAGSDITQHKTNKIHRNITLLSQDNKTEIIQEIIDQEIKNKQKHKTKH